MRDISKILGVIFLLTFIALMYVNQQVLIYQMARCVKENQDIYSKLVDHHKILRYNVLNLRSPINLEKRLLSKEIELAMPSKWQVVRLENPAKNKAVSVYKNVTKKGLFANLFVKDGKRER